MKTFTKTSNLEVRNWNTEEHQNLKRLFLLANYAKKNYYFYLCFTELAQHSHLEQGL